MTIIYILMFVMGVIGNIAVCFVIVHNKSMHTATNYYLFSLAISDLIILIIGKLSIGPISKRSRILIQAGLLTRGPANSRFISI